MSAKRGHNSGGMLRSFIERIERLKEEQDALAQDIRDIYAEARGNGFDKTAMGQVIAIRRQRAKNPTKFEERSAIVDLYLAELEEPDPHTHTRARARDTNRDAVESGVEAAAASGAADDTAGEESRAKASKGKTGNNGKRPSPDGDASRLTGGRTPDADEAGGNSALVGAHSDREPATEQFPPPEAGAHTEPAGSSADEIPASNINRAGALDAKPATAVLPPSAGEGRKAGNPLHRLPVFDPGDPPAGFDRRPSKRKAA